MKSYAIPFIVLPAPALAHDTSVVHGHGADYLVPSLAGMLAAVSLIMAVRRLVRIQA